MKTVFITGTSSGLGKAAVKLFHEKGWKVIATLRNPEKAKDLVDLAGVTVLPLDITHPEQIKDVAERAIRSGGVDVVINNAAYGAIGPLESMTDEQVQKQIGTNLLGAIRVTQAFIPHFRERRSGTFINITSIAGLVTFPYDSIYHAAKFGLEAFSEGLSYEMGIFGIRVKTVAPGFIWSDFGSNAVITSAEPYQESMSHYLKVVGSMMDPSRVGTSPEGIASIVYDALMDESDRVHYVAGADAQQMYERALKAGVEASRKEMKALFLG